MLVSPESYTPGRFATDLVGLVWIVSGLVLIIGGWLHSIMTIASGICISRRMLHGFSLSMAGVNSTMIPIGPVMCYYCFILLNDPQIKSQYQASKKHNDSSRDQPH